MSPDDIERTMEFILRSQADSVARMGRVEETIDSLSSITGDLVGVSRQFLSTHGEFREANRLMATRVDRLEDTINLLTQIASSQSERLDRLDLLEDHAVDPFRLRPCELLAFNRPNQPIANRQQLLDRFEFVMITVLGSSVAL